MHSEADRQLPRGNEIFLDHVGHFVRDPETASVALDRAGFAPTPASIQVNADPRGGPPQPTGTGNITAMLRRGYIECLFKTADTPLGEEFGAAIERYAGVHLAAFSTADPQAAHGRLGSSGFRTRPIVHMERPVDTENGPSLAAFSVVRIEPGQMPEGRIQILAHRTEDTVWQPRWLQHPNGALGLTDLVVATEDVREAAARFGRFTGRAAQARRHSAFVQLDRGCITCLSPEAFSRLFSPEVSIPQLPFMGAYGMRVGSLAALEAALNRGGLPNRRLGAAVIARFPEELGIGVWVFSERAEANPWR